MISIMESVRTVRDITGLTAGQRWNRICMTGMTAIPIRIRRGACGILKTEVMKTETTEAKILKEEILEAEIL